MSLKNKNLDDEIDLIDLILVIWKNKLKVLLSIFIGVTIMYLNISMKKSSFSITSEVKPIQDSKEIYYETYNSYISKLPKKTLNFKNINKQYLYDLFIDELNEGKIFEGVIKDFNMIKKDDYDNIDDYNEATRSASSSIILLPPIVDLTRQINKPNWSIQFRTKNKTEAKKFLKEVEVKTNEAIRTYLINSFEKLILSEKKINQYNVEDINFKIKNSLEHYDRYIKDRLIYLEEQSAIARRLEIKKNTLTVQNFDTLGGVISEFKGGELPYYTNGYVMIEKEIDNIRNRTDGKPFIAQMNDFISEQSKIKFTSTKRLMRLNEIFKEISMLKSENFSAAKIMYLSATFSSSRFSDIQKLIIAAFIAAIVGAIYVLLANEFQKRKQY